MRLRITKQRREALQSLRACADVMLDAGDYSADEERNLKNGIELIDLILVTSRSSRKAVR